MENIFVIGINFKNAGTEIRSAFSMDTEKQLACFQWAQKAHFQDFVVLSTCNRSEMYGCGSMDEVEKMMIDICKQSKEIFNTYKFIKTGKEAIKHIFQVASGLNSQILGDYEILGQFKIACKTAKTFGLLGPVFERMSNTCIQASKEIKTKTQISKGTVSASYAAIEILKEKIGENTPVKCLLIGTGKFGNKISKNIKHYLPAMDLTIANRTLETAVEIADKEGFKVLPFENIQEKIGEFEVLILSTTADTHIVQAKHLLHAKTRLILDLSIPQTVHPDCKKNPSVQILDIDSISEILNKSFENRKTYLPIANEIIKNHILKFIDWRDFYKKRNQILLLKKMLLEAGNKCPHLCQMEEKSKEEFINKAIQSFAVNLRENKIIPFEPEKMISRFIQYSQAL